MSAADARRDLGIHLQTGFPTWRVLDPTDSLEDIRKPVLVLFRDQVVKLPQAPTKFMQDTFTLWLLVPVGTAEDDLDGALDDVLEFLDESVQTVWSEAQRGVFSDLPGYQITLTTSSRRG